MELIRDSITLLLPTSDEQIHNALQSLNGFKLLDGFRGKPKADIERVVDTIRSIVNFAETHCENLVEMDINPLLITQRNCIAADVMICELSAVFQK